MLEMQRRNSNVSSSSSSSNRAFHNVNQVFPISAAKLKQQMSAPPTWSKLGVILLSTACLFSFLHFNGK